MNEQSGISCIMDEQTVARIVRNMSEEIYKYNPEAQNLCIIGIRRRGASIVN